MTAAFWTLPDDGPQVPVYSGELGRVVTDDCAPVDSEEIPF